MQKILVQKGCLYEIFVRNQREFDFFILNFLSLFLFHQEIGCVFCSYICPASYFCFYNLFLQKYEQQNKNAEKLKKIVSIEC